MIKSNIRSFDLDQKIQPRLAAHVHEKATIYLNIDTFFWWVMVGPPWWIPLWPDVEAYQPPFLERIESGQKVFEEMNHYRKA